MSNSKLPPASISLQRLIRPVGSGKTSLLKAIVQVHEDIVHVDPLPQSFNQSEAQGDRRTFGKATNPNHHLRGGASFSEIYASTKPYPSWWSDLEDSRILRRKKSMGDVVLERNLCFVDSHCRTLSRADQTESVIEYMKQQLLRTLAAVNTFNTDLQGLLGGHGGSQVDVVLYLISEGKQ